MFIRRAAPVAYRAFHPNQRKGRPDSTDIVRILGRVHKLPTLPPIVLTAMKVIEDSDSSARDLAEVLSHDQAGTARLLRVANSAFYAFSRQVSTVREAVVVLGFRNVQSLVLSSVLVNQFGGKGEGEFDRELFWQHSVACGIASQILAVRMHCKRHVEAFTAGILHDLGRIILDQYAHEDFFQVLKLVKEQGLSSSLAEQEVFGTDHAKIGGVLARQWGIPAPLVEAITMHHNPLVGEKVDDLALFVNLGDSYCMQNGICSGFEEPSSGPSTMVLSRLGLSTEDLSNFLSPFELIADRAKAFISSASG